MFLKKAELTFMVTLFAVVFTSLTYIFPPHYAQLWLSLEIIIIPTMYLIGYEFMMEKQRRKFEQIITSITYEAKELEKDNLRLRKKIK